MAPRPTSPRNQNKRGEIRQHAKGPFRPWVGARFAPLHKEMQLRPQGRYPADTGDLKFTQKRGGISIDKTIGNCIG